MSTPVQIKDILPQNVRDLLPEISTQILRHYKAYNLVYLKYLVSNKFRRVTFIYHDRRTNKEDRYVISWDNLHVFAANFPTEVQAVKLPSTLEALPNICTMYAEEHNVIYTGHKHDPSTKSVWVFAIEEGYDDDDPEDSESGRLQMQLSYTALNAFVKSMGLKISDTLN